MFSSVEGWYLSSIKVLLMMTRKHPYFGGFITKVSNILKYISFWYENTLFPSPNNYILSMWIISSGIINILGDYPLK